MKGRAELSARDVAARVVHRVVTGGAFSHIALDAELKDSGLEGRDRGLAAELVYGTLTWHLRLQHILRVFVQGDASRVDPDVMAALEVGLYQLGWLDRVPPHAAVSEAVASVRRLGRRGERAAGFVNGVLRTASRERARWPLPPRLEDDAAGHIAVAWALPRWIAARLVASWGAAEALQIARALAGRPGYTLRARGGGEGVEALCAEIGGAKVELVPRGVRVDRLEGSARAALERGAAVVQDAAAQLVGLLAAPGPGARVLDACAGLGGKAAHLAELAGAGAELVAVEPKGSRIELMLGTFRRLGLAAPTVVQGTLAEASTHEALRAPFDVVVIDAPCTGLGVLRRHPEARWTRSEADVAALAAVQAELLAAGAALVRPGGALIYSVCTFTDEEGPAQIARLLEERGGALDLVGAGGVDWAALPRSAQGFTLMPHQHDADGFFLSRVRLGG